MATTRKDLRGRTLRKGEMQRSSDKRYAYSLHEPKNESTPDHPEQLSLYV